MQNRKEIKTELGKERRKRKKGSLLVQPAQVLP